MKNELTCGVVRDLLPNYIEELTGEETNEAVRKHLDSCPECRDIYSSMAQDEAIFKPVETKEIDFLKKTRERGRKNIALAVLFVAVLFLSGLLVNRFFIGKEVKNPNLVQAQARVENGRVIVSGNLKDPGKGATALSFSEENGVVTVSLKQTAKSVFHDNAFYGCYDAKEPVVQVKLGKRILWDGVEKTLTITEEDADCKVGESVKAMAGTACGLQKLMKILNLTTGFPGNQLQEYRQNDKGLWECNGNTYQYRMVLTGRDPNAERDGRFVVLTNNPGLTYERVSKSLYGSQIEDGLDPKETVIVEIGGN